MNHNAFPIAVGVDIQNDFCSDGNLAVPNGDGIIEPFNALAQQTRDAGGLVVFTRDWHPAQTSHFDDWPVHCVENTIGAAFHSALDVQSQDIILSKGMGTTENAYSGFDGISPHGITLEDIVETELAKHAKAVMLIGGLATDYCVKATLLDALALQERIGEHKLAVIALENCMKAVNIVADDGAKAIETMKAHGVEFMNSGEVQL